MLTATRAARAAANQDQSDLGALGNGFVGVVDDQLVAQTFTAGITGELSRVSVHVQANQLVPVVAEIRATVYETRSQKYSGQRPT